MNRVGAPSANAEPPVKQTQSEGFDPCGLNSGTTTCDEDWDRDGVLDADEPVPETFISQVRVMQCTLSGNDISGFSAISTEILDQDETDDDSDYTYNRIGNMGGQSVEEHEGAYIDLTLEGGREYIIVVGASSGTGGYELNLKRNTQ